MKVPSDKGTGTSPSGEKSCTTTESGIARTLTKEAARVKRVYPEEGIARIEKKEKVAWLHYGERILTRRNSTKGGF